MKTEHINRAGTMVSAEELKVEGNKAFVNKEFKKAAKIYRDAIGLDERNPVLYCNRAICFIKLNDWNRALKDCSQGLSNYPDNGTRAKLHYRQGLAYKELGKTELARTSFQDVLAVDNNNISARKQLNDLNQEYGLNKKGKLGNENVPLSIQELDLLPLEFRRMMNLEKLDHEIQETKQEGKNSLEKELNYFDGSNNDQGSEGKFSSKPPMYYLSSLKRIPEHKKIKAYELVLSLEDEYYSDVFQGTGVDSEFLDFFIEAAEYISTHSTVPDWENRILHLLQLFSLMRRYKLSLLLCNRENVNKLLNKVKRTTREDLFSKYRDLLS